MSKESLKSLLGEPHLTGLLADLGVYERRARCDAADGQGLLRLAELLTPLLKMAPSGRLDSKAVKAAVLDLVLAKPTLNKTVYSNAVFAGQKTERLTTIFNHLRRLKFNLWQSCFPAGSSWSGSCPGLQIFGRGLALTCAALPCFACFALLQLALLLLISAS